MYPDPYEFERFQQFAEKVRKHYDKRESLFAGPDILPGEAERSYRENVCRFLLDLYRFKARLSHVLGRYVVRKRVVESVSEELYQKIVEMLNDLGEPVQAAPTIPPAAEPDQQ